MLGAASLLLRRGDTILQSAHRVTGTDIFRGIRTPASAADSGSNSTVGRLVLPVRGQRISATTRLFRPTDECYGRSATGAGGYWRERIKLNLCILTVVNDLHSTMDKMPSVSSPYPSLPVFSRQGLFSNVRSKRMTPISLDRHLQDRSATPQSLGGQLLTREGSS
jgi:hypothetical protein